MIVIHRRRSLAALADALRMNDDDLTHLRRLATVAQGTELCPTLRTPASTIRPFRTAPCSTAWSRRRRSSSTASPTCWRGPRRTNGWRAPLGILDRQPPNLARYTLLDDASSRRRTRTGSTSPMNRSPTSRSNSRPDPVTEGLIEELSAAGHRVHPSVGVPARRHEALGREAHRPSRGRRAASWRSRRCSFPTPTTSASSSTCPAIEATSSRPRRPGRTPARGAAGSARAS